MGHGRCGGCSAALTQELKNAAPGEGGFIAHWIEMLDEAREKVVSQYGDDHNRDDRRAMEQEGVKVSLANLRTFPYVREQEGNGELRLVVASFAIADGLLPVPAVQRGVFFPS